jgi:CDP-4-dehydro-6-deoxyglucose reductase
MSHRITVSPGGDQFHCPQGKTILDAALMANILISHGCRNGQCGSCLGRVIEGKIEYSGGFPDAISESEAARGDVLLCSAHPLSDVTIELRRPEVPQF